MRKEREIFHKSNSSGSWSIFSRCGSNFSQSNVIFGILLFLFLPSYDILENTKEKRRERRFPENFLFHLRACYNPRGSTLRSELRAVFSRLPLFLAICNRSIKPPRGRALSRGKTLPLMRLHAWLLSKVRLYDFPSESRTSGSPSGAPLSVGNRGAARRGRLRSRDHRKFPNAAWDQDAWESVRCRSAMPRCPTARAILVWANFGHKSSAAELLRTSFSFSFFRSLSLVPVTVATIKSSFGQR